MRVPHFISALHGDREAAAILQSTAFTRVAKGCVAFSFVLLLLLSFDQYIWFDEIFSLRFIEHSYADIIDFTAHDVHPPLYYFMLKTWVEILSFGSHDRYLLIVLSHLFSVLAYVCTALLCWRKLRETLGNTYTWLLLSCFAASYFIYAYALDIRMYSWGLFFVTATFLYALDIIDGKARWDVWLRLSLFTLCAAYTHNFTLISVAIVWLLLFCWIARNNRTLLLRWCIYAVATVVLFVPWAVVLLQQTARVADSYWISQLSPGVIVEFFLCPFAIAAWLLVVPFVVAIREVAWQRISYRDTMGLWVWAGTIVVGVVMSFAIRPLFIARYMVPACFCIWLSVFFMLRYTGERLKLMTAYILFVSCIAVYCMRIGKGITHYKQGQPLAAFLSTVEDDAVFVADDNRHNSFVLSYSTPQHFLFEGHHVLLDNERWQKAFPNHTVFEEKEEMWTYMQDIKSATYLITGGAVEDMSSRCPNYTGELVFEGVIEGSCFIYKLHPACGDDK